MKRIIFFIAAFAISTSFVTGQAKKNLTAKKSSVVKNSKASKKAKEEVVYVYNEDFAKGEELFGLNKPEEAIPYFEKCIDEKDINPDIWVHLGVAYYQTGDYAKSLACCTKGLTKENTNHKILSYNAGNSAYALTNYARAEACYAITLKEDDSFGPAYLNRANAQLKQDHLQDAKDNYVKYLEVEPQSPQKEKIEKLIVLLDEEINRRAKEKPELINPDFSNVKNDEVIVEEDQKEKVDYELPVEKMIVSDVDEELVRFEIPALPQGSVEEKKEEVVKESPGEFKKFSDLIIPEEKVAKKEEVKSEAFTDEGIKTPEESITIDKPEEEAVRSELARAPEIPSDLNVKDETEELAVIPEEVLAEGEKFNVEDLPVALYSLPAGYVTLNATSAGFSPSSPNSKNRREFFNVNASDSSKIVSYNFDIIDEYGSVVKSTTGKNLPKLLDWDGRAANGVFCEGLYTGRLTVNYRQGGSVSAESKPFECFSSELKVDFIPVTENFSPDGDGINDVMKFDVNVNHPEKVEEWKFEVKKDNKTVYERSGKEIVENLEWDGKTSSGEFVKKGDSLSYNFYVTDAFGVKGKNGVQTSVESSKPDPVVSKDVELSANSDGTLKISIPTLSFKINSYELVSTTQNDETLKKVYDILIDEKYEDYSVTITGYVNPDGEKWTAEEQKLALNRAKSVENKLKQLGVSSKRMKAECGDGKTKNKEYNRRVEFKLKK